MAPPPLRTKTTAAPSAKPAATKHRPHEVLLKLKEQCLYLGFEEGLRVSLSAEFLRFYNPVPRPAAGKAAGNGGFADRSGVALTGAELVGTEALRLVFDDGYDTGVYSWDYLHQLGQNHEALWSEYLALRAAHGHRRNN